MSYVKIVRAGSWLGVFLFTMVAAQALAQDAPEVVPPAAEAPPASEPPSEPSPDPAPPEPPPARPDVPSPDAVPPPAPTVTVEPPPAAVPAPRDEGVDSRILFGGIALGVGGAAVVAGTVVAIIAAVRYGDLECPDDACPPERHEDARDYNALRIPSGVTIFAGSVLALTGLVFLVNGMSDDDKFVAVEVGPGSLSLRGRF